MVNRVFKWWNEVIVWKERWEKLFPASFLKSKDFQRAELKKLEKILSFPSNKLNEDERLSRKLVRQQYMRLNRTIYPNPLIRLGVNATKLTASAIKWSLNKLNLTHPSKNKKAVQNKKEIPVNDSEIKSLLEKGIAVSKGHTKSKGNKNVDIQTGGQPIIKPQISTTIVKRIRPVAKNGLRRKR